jgi:hypothetical protein
VWPLSVMPKRGKASFASTTASRLGRTAPDTRVFVDDEVLLDLFDRLADDERSQRQAFRFVLALVLLRKRRLKFDRREEVDGGVQWHMSARGEQSSTGPWVVVDPGLGDDDVIALHEQLGEILHGDL